MLNNKERRNMTEKKTESEWQEVFHKEFPEVQIRIKKPVNFGHIFYLMKKLSEIRVDLDPNHTFNKIKNESDS